MPDIVVAGHVCLDVFPRLDRASDFPPGALIEVGPVKFSTGGAVANTGGALHRLGVDVRLLGQVGDDAFGRLVAESLGNLGRDLFVRREVATSYTIVLNRPGSDRTFLHCPGANDEFDPERISNDALAGARILHFGYPPLMRSIYSDGGKRLAALYRRAKTLGLLTSLDMSLPDPESDSGRVDWRAFLAEVLPYVDAFCPSEDELKFMLGPDEPSLQCIGLGAGVVLLKRGDQGADLYVGPRNTMEWVLGQISGPCFPVRVVGTTGSGDATIAGFLYGILTGLSPAGCLRSGLAVGAASCEAEDATSAIRPWAEIAERFELN